jgi:hypothetical protein
MTVDFTRSNGHGLGSYFARATSTNEYQLREGELAACARAYGATVPVETDSEPLYSVVLSSDSDAIWALVLAYLIGGKRYVYVQRASKGKGVRPTNVNITTLVDSIGKLLLSRSGTEQWGGHEVITSEDRIITILILIALTGCHDFFPGLITVGFKSALHKVSEFFEIFRNNDLRLGKLLESEFSSTSAGTTVSLSIIDIINTSYLVTQSTLMFSIWYPLCRR